MNDNSLDHFFRGAFSIDIVLFTYNRGKLQILLQQKKELPDQEELGLPGKLILPNEDTDEALDRFMVELIGTRSFYRKQLRTFSEVDRHPLGRIITFAYYGLIQFDSLEQELPAELSWCDIDRIPELAFDHNRIYEKVIWRFQKGLLRHPIVFELLQEKFALSEMIAIYEQAFEQKIDKPNFRKKVLSSGMVEALGEFEARVGNTGRPAELYRLTTELNKADATQKIQFNFRR